MSRHFASSVALPGGVMHADGMGVRSAIGLHMRSEPTTTSIHRRACSAIKFGTSCLSRSPLGARPLIRAFRTARLPLMFGSAVAALAGASASRSQQQLRWRNSRRYVSRRAVGGAAGTAARRVDVARLVARCIQLGETCSAKMKEVQARPSLGTVDKGGEQNPNGEYIADVQTAADREVEELCVSTLSAEFPGVTIVAEEDTKAARERDAEVSPLTATAAVLALSAPWPPDLRDVDAARVVVFIDPLDGTSEFVAGNLGVVTNLFGVAVDGVPVAGVINQPWADDRPAGRTVWGGPGAGVHGVDPEATFQGTICTNRTVRSTRCVHALNALEELATGDVQRVSATGYNLLSVLDGSYSLFVLTRHNTKKWDSCAGEALLAAVGGVVTDAIGRRYRYAADPSMHQNLCGLLAARNHAIHERAAAIIARVVEPWPLDVDDASVIAEV